MAQGRERGQQTPKSQLIADRLKTHMLKHHGIRDYDPLLALADISVDTTVPIKIRAQCTMELCGYVHAKRRAVDINSSGETPINFIIAGPNSPVVGE